MRVVSVLSLFIRYLLSLLRKSLQEVQDAVKTRLAEVAKAHKEFDLSKRELKLSQAKCDAIVASVPNLRMQITDLQHGLKRAKEETARKIKVCECSASANE